MNTPFDLLRNKNKKRKQRIHQSISPVKHSFSVQTTPRVYTTADDSRSKQRSTQKKLRNNLSESNRIKAQVQKKIEEDNYHIIVKNAIKKSSNVRLTLSRSGQPLDNCRPPTSQKSNSNRNLLIEGTHCGRDLIKLNRKKLEELIAKIEGNNTHIVNSQAIPEIVISKCKAVKSSLISKEQRSERMVPFLKSREYSGQCAPNEGLVCLREEDNPEGSFFIHSKAQKFDTRQFLKCSQMLKKQGENELNSSAYSLVLDSNQVVNFIRESKKRKTIFRGAKTNEENMQSPQNSSVFSTREILNFKSPPKREYSQTAGESCRWKRSISEKKGEGKAKINCINFKNLNGWESPEETVEVNFMNPSYL